jgi:hypothetical protein
LATDLLYGKNHYTAPVDFVEGEKEGCCGFAGKQNLRNIARSSFFGLDSPTETPLYIVGAAVYMQSICPKKKTDYRLSLKLETKCMF